MKVIVVVEDNVLNMKLIRAVLVKSGYEVIEAVNAELGLEIIRLKHPDLVLMDIQLPGMDGLQATSLLKAEPELSHIPVLALTALAMDGDRERAVAAGCDGYITKPLQYKEMLALIEKTLG